LRKILISFFVLLLAASLSAQITNRGNIFGTVVDTEGNALPGVTVTLISSVGPPVTAVTSADGRFRFISLPPAKDYKVKCELAGFKTRTEENIVVVLGGNTDIDVKMEMGVIEEQVTVVAVSPVIDSKKTNVGQNISQDVLQMLPTARDPWVVLQMVPSVTVDRENLGGTESGQQAYFVGKGGTSDQNQWTMDGVLITDPAAIGAAPSYFDFDTFEEMQVITGGGDITAQTGGVALNLVTRRGGNRVSLGGRFYYTDPKFQAAYSASQLASLGVSNYNLTNGIKDYGFNAGGPIWKDKAWLWGSYGVQDIKNFTIVNVADNTLLSNYVAKLDVAAIPGNNLEIFMHSGNKEKFGRDSDPYWNPLGNHQTARFHFGTPIWKAQDDQMIGDNLLVSFKFGYSHAGFLFLPMQNEALDNWTSEDVTTGINNQFDYYYDTNRPLLTFSFYTNYFNDKLLGVSHEIKFGVEYSRRFTTTDSSSAGNVYHYYNYNYPTYDPGATGNAANMIIDPNMQYISTWRGYYIDSKILAWTGYLTDTITAGRLNVLLGLRYDYQKPYLNPFTMTHVNDTNGVWTKYFSSAATTAIGNQMPGLSVPGYSADYKWSLLQPRIGITYDLFGNGKTLLKASFARYGEFMGIGEAGYYYPSGTGGWMDFWWRDANSDGKADVTELFWFNPTTYGLDQVFNSSGTRLLPLALNTLYQGVMWDGFDPANPQQVGGLTTTIDPNTNSQNTWEGILTLEREVVTDFQVAVDLTYRRMDNFRWSRDYYPTTGHIRDSSDYLKVSYTVPDLTSRLGPTASNPNQGNMGTGVGKNWYVLANTANTASTLYRYYGPHDGYNQYYYDAVLRFNKRLSHRWMFNGSFSYEMQKQHWDTNGYTDPTQIWAQNDLVYSQSMGAGSGKISQYTFSPWMVKLEGLYQLPLDFDISGTFTARAGHIIAHTMVINDASLPNPRSRSATVYLDNFGIERLPTMWNMNFRIEKMVKCLDTGRIYFMADVFNVFNQDILNRRYQRTEGTYYVATGAFVKSTSYYKANEVLNPRMTRFGVRFVF
jgi:hypothetical protein